MTLSQSVYCLLPKAGGPFRGFDVHLPAACVCLCVCHAGLFFMGYSFLLCVRVCPIVLVSSDFQLLLNLGFWHGLCRTVPNPSNLLLLCVGVGVRSSDDTKI